MAVFVAAQAVNSELQTTWTFAVLLVVFVVSGLVGTWQVRRFRRLNGVWISGLHRDSPRASMVIYLVGVLGSSVVAFGAAHERLWWLVAVGSIAAGVAFIVSSRDWMRRYHKEHGS